MLSVLFWNMGNRNGAERLARLASVCAADIVIVTELPTSVADASAADALSGATNRAFAPAHFLGPSRLRMFSVFDSKTLLNSFNGGTGEVTAWRLEWKPAFEVLLVGVHLQSKSHTTGLDRDYAARTLAETVRKEELEAGHSRTILVGDFNMNPFESGVVHAEGLHAVMTRNLARRGSRVYKGKAYPFLYNPMWSLFGESSDAPHEPPGTFYLAGGHGENLFWNMYDQVLVRPELMDAFRDLRILHDDGEQSLLTASGRPHRGTASDHLPITFRLDI